jgi:protein disulfide-isomerase A1
MEATENDLPPTVPFQISGFPTLKFKPAGSREFINYDGDRSLESLIAFVEDNAKNSLQTPPAPTPEAQVPLTQPSPSAEEAGHDEL